MKAAFHYFLTGQVQGVGFRWHTKQLAQALRLSGWIRNLEDGRIELLLQGDSEVLLGHEERLLKGPPGALVSHIDKKAWLFNSEIRNFTIIS